MCSLKLSFLSIIIIIIIISYEPDLEFVEFINGEYNIVIMCLNLMQVFPKFPVLITELLI